MAWLRLIASASICCLAAILTAEPAQAVAAFPALLDSAASSSPTTTDWISAIAEAVTALSVIGVFWQIFITRNASKSERTRAFQERYQSDAFASSARRTLGCTDVENAGQCVDVIEAWSNRRDGGQRILPRPHSETKASVQDVEKTLSLFEEMGTAYKLGEFQDMCQALKDNDASLAAEPSLKPSSSIRALCLPKGHGERVDDDAAWAASRRITLALSAFVAAVDERGELGNRLSGLAADLEALEPPTGQKELMREWDVILIPSSIDQPCDDKWKQARFESIKLGRVFHRFTDYRSLEIAMVHLERAATAAQASSAHADSAPVPQ